jgi:hypothetical protein
MMRDETMFFAFAMTVVLCVAAIIGYAVQQHWAFHNALREQGVVRQMIQEHAEYIRIEDLKLESP